MTRTNETPLYNTPPAPQFNGMSKKRSPQSNMENGKRRIRLQNYKFQPLNREQATLSQATLDSDLIFAHGPAGTGKTHVGVARAIYAYEHKEIQKIILARPAISGEEELGFLPGTAEEKIAPYMRPLYDELDKIIGAERRKKMMENGEIEIVPLATMRGRTFDDAFIVIDEAQNATEGQMEMILTRIGHNSKVFVAGDPDQSDLPAHKTSGLKDAIKHFSGVEGVSSVLLVEVVRSPMAQRAVDVYNKKRQGRHKNYSPTC